MNKYQKTYKQCKKEPCKDALHISLYIVIGVFLGLALAEYLIRTLW